MAPLTQQIFKSLNCPKCDTPYSKTASARSTPTQTYCYDMQAMCMGCYKKQRKIDRRSRVHQCGRWDCFLRQRIPSYYLIELLSSGAFKLDKQRKGYMQTTQSITMPECPLCLEEYSLRDAKNEPFGLVCGHAVCNGCFAQMAELKSSRGFTHVYKCPLCPDNRLYSQTSWENPLKAFLREFEEKSKQQEAEMKRICGDCRKEVPLFEMFQCMDCEDKMLCSRCVCKTHRSHQIIDLEVVEMKKLENVTREMIIPQVEAYNVCLPELQSDLIKNFKECQKKILNRTDQLGYLNGLVEAKEQQEACIAFGGRFEEICEKYLGDLLSFNTGIEKLIDDINESPE